MSQAEDNELVGDSKVDFIDLLCEKYNNGVNEEFNFSRNKRKTELVILFNELNMAISKEKREPFITLDHINFRMEDLEEAVAVKKEELETMTERDIPFSVVKQKDKMKKMVYSNGNQNNGNDKNSNKKK